MQFPLALLQGLALGGQLGFGGIAGAAAFAKAGLQLLLLGCQGAAPLLIRLVLLFPASSLLHQGVHSGHQPLFIGAQGLELVAEALGAQGPFAPGRQQPITLAAGRGQGRVGRLQLALQPLPAGCIAGGLHCSFGLFQGEALLLQRQQQGFELLLALQIALQGLLQLAQAAAQLLLALQLGG